MYNAVVQHVHLEIRTSIGAAKIISAYRGVGLGRVVRKVRQHPDDHEFESQQWQ
jgi:hypothetical protein